MISPNYVELHYPAHTILPVEMSIDLSKLREYVYEEKVSSLRHIGINPVAICYLICFVYIVVSQEIAISEKELSHGGERLQFDPSLPKNNVFGNRGSEGDICDVTLACKG